MSGLMDKAKAAVGKAAGNKSTEEKIDNAANKQIDSATDRAGLGDKYDSKIDQFADKQINNQMQNQASGERPQG